MYGLNPPPPLQAQAKSERSGEGAREGRKATADHLPGEGSKGRLAMATSGANLENKVSAKGRVW